MRVSELLRNPGRCGVTASSDLVFFGTLYIDMVPAQLSSVLNFFFVCRGRMARAARLETRSDRGEVWRRTRAGRCGGRAHRRLPLARHEGVKLDSAYYEDPMRRR